MCRKHPLHDTTGVVLAKILLIGRVYAAAIERRRSKVLTSDDFYLHQVAPRIKGSPIDKWIEAARQQRPFTGESLRVMVEVHDKTTQLFSRISGLEKRSLASKYLHFHVPNLFFIYDARAVEGMRLLGHVVGRASRYEGVGDNEYRKFAEKCFRLRRHCRSTFAIDLRPREIDNLLLELAAK